MADEEKIISRYKERIKNELEKSTNPDKKIEQFEKSKRPITVEYENFKKSFMSKRLTYYEKACNYSEKIKFPITDKQVKNLNIRIEEAHLGITPQGAISLSYITAIIVFFLGAFISFGLLGSMFLLLLSLIVAAVLFFILQKVPDFLSTKWKMRTSNQMILCIFYIVTYMKHTSNLERAIEFASIHLKPPLALDMKKILWDVETQEFSNITESINHYLERWKETNREFIEVFHLIVSSLYEGSESRRLDLLDKSLDVLLSETYEKMLHYAHNMGTPMTMLNMLGVILPILGLVMLPLIVSFMSDESLSPGRIALYIAVIYNILLPVGVYYMGRRILEKRPSGGGKEKNKKSIIKGITIKLGFSEITIKAKHIAILIGAGLLLIGLFPMIIHFLDPAFDIAITETSKFLNYICPPGKIACDASEKIGPFGLGAGIMSLFITLAVGISAGIYYKLSSKNVIKIRDKTKELEEEFASALFQLGNRLGDGLPVEVAFRKVAAELGDSTTGQFFKRTVENMIKMGMSIEEALFNKETGTLSMFPSEIIKSSMKILVESSKKGPKIAAQALLSMSRYIREMHRVDERLRDLLGETLSSMKSQIKFMTPAISGIVVGITSMITTILAGLSGQLTKLVSGGQVQGQASQFTGIVDMFGTGLPIYYFQIIIGIYVVELIFILTIISNGIEFGEDDTMERYQLGKNLTNSTLMYCAIALVVMILFNSIAGYVMVGTMT